MISRSIDIWKHSEEYLDKGITVINNFLEPYYVDYLTELLYGKEDRWIHSLESEEMGLKEYGPGKINDIEAYENHKFSVYQSYKYAKPAYSQHKLSGVNSDDLRVFSNKDFVKFVAFITSHNLYSLSFVQTAKYEEGDLGYSYIPKGKDHKVNFLYDLTKDWKLDFGGLFFLENCETGDIHHIKPSFNSITLYDKSKFMSYNRIITPVTISKSKYQKYLITGGIL